MPGTSNVSAPEGAVKLLELKYVKHDGPTLYSKPVILSETKLINDIFIFESFIEIDIIIRFCVFKYRHGGTSLEKSCWTLNNVL